MDKLDAGLQCAHIKMHRVEVSGWMVTVVKSSLRQRRQIDDLSTIAKGLY